MGAGRAVGIDVGARFLHLAIAEGSPGQRAGVVATKTVAAADLDHVLAACAGAGRIGIDAPDRPSTGPHLHDPTASGKFRPARCGELAAGTAFAVWVPWVTPIDPPFPSWMLTGFGLWAALRAAGHEPMEVYPAGCFYHLAGRRWPPRKTTPGGRAYRRAVLDGFLRLPASAEGWGHDTIDAAMTAIVAWQGPEAALRADHAGEPHWDGSTVWLASPSGRRGRPGGA